MLHEIRQKVEAGERLSAADGEYLFSPEVDLHAVGELADVVRRRKNGDAAYYNLNLHINPTNVCIYRCACAPTAATRTIRGRYTMSRAEVLARAKEAADAGCTELHIVGGVHPRKAFDWYLGMIGDLHAAFPRLHLKAWTAVEIDHFAQVAKRPVRSILEDLMAAGLGSMPGGGAEIFDPQVRTKSAPARPTPRHGSTSIARPTNLGLRTNASMLYGHVESVGTASSTSFACASCRTPPAAFRHWCRLSFIPKTRRCRILHRVSALEDLRVVAVSRLMLDNFDHVKAYWISLGVGTAQTALAYGADDLDGTVRHERIHHDAGATSPEALTVEQLRALIAEAGRVPVERDSLYRRVVRDENSGEWSVEREGIEESSRQLTAAGDIRE